jgi:hypothetical protein
LLSHFNGSSILLEDLFKSSLILELLLTLSVLLFTLGFAFLTGLLATISFFDSAFSNLLFVSESFFLISSFFFGSSILFSGVGISSVLDLAAS